MMGFWLLLSCGDQVHDSADPCPRSPPLTYSNFGEGILNKHCIGCHSSLLPEDRREGAPLGVDLDSYASVLVWADRIHARVIDSEDMPPGGGLVGEELEMIQEWLVCQVAQDREQLETWGE